MKPMLLTPIGAKDLIERCHDDDWVLQEKMDGVRVVTVIRDSGHATLFTRSGTSRPVELTVPTPLPPGAILDAEMVRGTCHYFDFLLNDKDRSPYHERLARLQSLADVVRWVGDRGRLATVVTTYSGSVAKLQATANLIASGAEGVVVKNLHGAYQHGRSTDVLKYKFVKTARCRILDFGSGGKQNFVLGCWEPGRMDWLAVGLVSALTGDGPSLAVGDDCTVTYLKFTLAYRLREPVRPMRLLGADIDDLSITQFFTATKETSS